MVKKRSSAFLRGHFLAFSIQIYTSMSEVILQIGKCEEVKGIGMEKFVKESLRVD